MGSTLRMTTNNGDIQAQDATEDMTGSVVLSALGSVLMFKAHDITKGHMDAWCLGYNLWQCWWVAWAVTWCVGVIQAWAVTEGHV